MADVANSLNTSTPGGANSGEIMSPESPDSVLLSPGVKEAMDRIFPRSASQFLAQRVSFDEDPVIGSISPESNQNRSSSRVQSTSKLASNSTSSLTHIIPSSHVTTAITTTIAPATTNLATSASNESPILSTVRSHDSPPVTPAGKISEDRKTENVSSDKTSEMSKLKLVKIRISKADMEIIKSCETQEDDSRDRYSRQRGSVDISSSECHSVLDSDSEDMCRPFANAVKEKKKHKKKKRKVSSPVEKLIINNGVNSEDEFKSSSKSAEWEDITSSAAEWNAEDSISLKKVFSKTKKSKTLSLKLSREPNGDRVCKVPSAEDASNCDGFPQGSIIENGSVSLDSLYRDDELAGEEFSNLSFSSSKENRKQKKSFQKLPKTKRVHFNVGKDKKYLKRFFPPCYVVAEKMDTSGFHSSKYKTLGDVTLPLSERIKHLSDMCESGLIYCDKRHRVSMEAAARETTYKNIFEETVVPGNSEDEFEKSRGGRSLRKRDKNISYVEPTEDDILVDYAAKQTGIKRKEPTAKSEDDGSPEHKKRKKQDVSETDCVVLLADFPDKTSLEKKHSNDKEKSSDSKKVSEHSNNVDSEKKKKQKKKTPQVETTMASLVTSSVTPTSSAPVTVGQRTEVVVYPKPRTSETNTYHARTEGREQLAAKLAEKAKDIYSREKSRAIAPESPSVTRISILPASSPPGSLPRPFVSNTVLTSLPISFSSGLSSRSAITGISGAPLPPHLSTAGTPLKPPQYCMVKMDGKDVLLQLVPSSGLGVPTSAPGMSMILPGGKRFVVPPVNPTIPVVTSPPLLLGQPPISVPNSTPGIGLPLSAVATTGQGHVSSMGSLSSMFGIPVMARPSLTAHTSTPISLSALPVIPASQLAGLTSTPGIRPTPLSTSSPSVTNSEVNTTACITVLTTTTSGVSKTVSLGIAPNTSVSVLTSSSMAAPNTTTVVRNVRVPGSSLRAIVPNQSTGVRSVRIFVPGCSATGTPGRFATLGSVASGSPLTRLSASSELLPQRKETTDQTLSPEQRAARRRKLEKKYPLPPGVVIKTEPLEIPTASSSISTTASGTRSLLSQNLQLISSAARPGTSIRIISPSLATALSGRNIRGSGNVIYRAASVGGRQTILVPTSLGLVASTRSVTTASATVSTLSLASVTTTATTTSATAVTTTTSPSTTAVMSTSASMSTTVSEPTPTSGPDAPMSTPHASLTSNTFSAPVNGSPSTALSTSDSELGMSTAVDSVISNSVSESISMANPVVTTENGPVSTVVSSSVTEPIPTSVEPTTLTDNSATTAVEATVAFTTDIPALYSSSSITNLATCATALPALTNSVQSPLTATEPSTQQPGISESTDNSGGISACESPMDSQASTATAEEAPTINNTAPTSVETTMPSGSGVATTTSPTVSSSSNSNPSLTPSAADVEALKGSVDNLRKFVQGQELQGLRGDRLEKLKGLLQKKEEHLKEIMKTMDLNMISVSEVSQASGENDVTGNEEPTSSTSDEPGGTETDPFVID